MKPKDIEDSFETVANDNHKNKIKKRIPLELM